MYKKNGKKGAVPDFIEPGLVLGTCKGEVDRHIV